VIKRVPHHPLPRVKEKFATVDMLEITTSAVRTARAIGCTLEDVVAVVQALEPADFVKSETAHSPPNSRVWHDTYVAPFDGLNLYFKFAGATLIDLTLTSFKEQ
jgi:motility quorum-sensing regulator / GCU-specific mRNA interferase toxin